MIRTPERQRELDEIVRRGREMYAARVEPLMRPEDDGKFVAVDVASGDYEIDPDDLTVVTRFRERRPGAESLLIRVGSATTYDIRRVTR